MKTATSRRNSLVVTIPVLLASVAWVFLVFMPVQETIDRLDDEASEMRQYCDRAGALLPVLQRTSREVAEIHDRIANWSETVPSRRDLTSLLGTITASARSAGLRTTRFNPEPIMTHERIAKVPLSMVVTGPFPNVFEFLGKLESMTECIWIDSLEIEKTEVDRQDVSCEIVLAIFMDNPKDSDQTNYVDGR
ncbi:MAG: type 4a pilus biogenesis protein PilO [Pirellulaceae bacterium]|nr:type 4a pilus biogenesis protein PilO [Pirellulaceae bacterium]